MSDPTLKEGEAKYILLLPSRELGSERLRLVTAFCDVNVKWIGHYPESYPGDSLSDCSDSSEKLLQRGREEGQYTCEFGEGGVHAIKHMFLRSISLAASGGSCSMLDLCCTFCCCA